MWSAISQINVLLSSGLVLTMSKVLLSSQPVEPWLPWIMRTQVSKDFSLDTVLLLFALTFQRLVTWLPQLKKANAETSNLLMTKRSNSMKKSRQERSRERTIQELRLMMKRAKVSQHLFVFGITIELVASLWWLCQSLKCNVWASLMMADTSHA